MKFTASVPTFTHSHNILNKGINVNFGGTGDFLEVQGEGAPHFPGSGLGPDCFWVIMAQLQSKQVKQSRASPSVSNYFFCTPTKFLNSHLSHIKVIIFFHSLTDPSQISFSNGYRQLVLVLFQGCLHQILCFFFKFVLLRMSTSSNMFMFHLRMSTPKFSFVLQISTSIPLCFFFSLRMSTFDQG